MRTNTLATVIFLAVGLAFVAMPEVSPAPNPIEIPQENPEPYGAALEKKAEALIGTTGGECVYFVQRFLGLLNNCQKIDCEKKPFRGHADHIKPNATEPLVGSAVLIKYKSGGHAAAVIVVMENEIRIVESNIKLDGKIAVRTIRKDDPKIIGYYDFRPEKINEYFDVRNMPLAGTGDLMVAAADKYNIDWRLLPAIAVRESSGGLYSITPNNPFGWGSSKKIKFETIAQAINTVAKNLAGENPATAYAYAGKSTRGKLESYNPPSIVPTYTEEIFEIIKAIGGNTGALGSPA